MELRDQLQAVDVLHPVSTERKVGIRFGRFGEEKNYHLYVGNRATTQRATVWDVRVSNPDRKKRFFSSPKRSRPPLGSLMKVNRWRREVSHSPPSNAEVKNKWSSTSTPTICLYSMDRDKSIFIIKALTQQSEDKLQGQHGKIRGSSCNDEPQNKGIRNNDDNDIIKSFSKVTILLHSFVCIL